MSSNRQGREPALIRLRWVVAVLVLSFAASSAAPVEAAEPGAVQAPLQIDETYKNNVIQVLASLPGVEGSISRAANTREESAARAVYYAKFGKAGFYKIVVGAGLDDLLAQGWTRLTLTPRADIAAEEVEVAWRAGAEWIDVYARYKEGDVMLSVQARQPQGTDPATAGNQMLRRLEELIDLAQEFDLFYTCDGVLVAPYIWSIGAEVSDDFGPQVEQLRFDIRRWRNSRREIDSTPLREIEAQIPLALKIARINGVDAEMLSLIHEQGTKLITAGSFWTPDNERPEMQQPHRSEFMPGRYEQQLAEAQREHQTAVKAWETSRDAHKLRIVKRLTVAYLDALIASRQVLPACCISRQRMKTVTVNGVEVPTLNCPDPVIERLKRYRNAVASMATTEVEKSGVVNDKIEQLMILHQLFIDSLATLPLLGDAMDLFALYAGEDLAGNCLTPFEQGIAVVLVALPVAYSGTKLAHEAAGKIRHHATEAGVRTVEYLGSIARDPKALRYLPRVKAFLHGVLETDLAQGLAKRWKLPKAHIEDLDKLLKQIPYDVDRIPIADVDAALKQAYHKADNVPDFSAMTDAKKRKALSKKWKEDAVIWRTLEDASEASKWIGDMPKELRLRALRRSNAAMRTLRSMQDEVPEIMNRSNIVREHIEAFREVAQTRNEILIFRSVNPDATRRIEEFFGTKNMTVKGKSADWGVHAAFIPVDQNLGKLGNPEMLAELAATNSAKHAEQLEKIAKFKDEVAECIRKKVCFEDNLRLREGEVMILPAEPGMRDKPLSLVFTDDGRYLKRTTESEGSGKVVLEEISLTADEIKEAKKNPLKVLTDADGRPVTADYDLLAFGYKDGPPRSPGFDDKLGFVNGRVRKSVAALQEASRKADEQLRALRGAGQEAAEGVERDVVHHGPEVWYPGSPGAMSVDEYVTVVAPKNMPGTKDGLLRIPRCDAQCMEQWCKQTHSCGGLEVCVGDPPRNAPCIPVDPDRLLKDFMHHARLHGWDLPHNSKWGWGKYNAIGGHNLKRFLEAEAPSLIGRLARRAIVVGLKRGSEYLFECQTPEGEPAN